MASWELVGNYRSLEGVEAQLVEVGLATEGSLAAEHLDRWLVEATTGHSQLR